jgi:hypothetical protein
MVSTSAQYALRTSEGWGDRVIGMTAYLVQLEEHLQIVLMGASLALGKEGESVL